MSDQILGLGILDDRGKPWRLFATGVPSPGSGRDVTIVMIPVRPRGSPREGAEACWEFDLAGDQIHVTPSVRISVNLPIPGRADEFPGVFQTRELFHNGADWRIRFVLWSTVADKLPDDHPWDYWRRANADLLGGGTG